MEEKPKKREFKGKKSDTEGRESRSGGSGRKIREEGGSDRRARIKRDDTATKPSFSRREDDRPRREGSRERKFDDRPARTGRSDERSPRPYSARREDDRPRREGSRERKFDDRPARTGRSDERSPRPYSARREDDRPRREGSRDRKFDDRPARTGRSDERSPRPYSARREDDRPRREDSRERKFDDRPARTGRSDERSPRPYSARREDDRPRREDSRERKFDDRPARTGRSDERSPRPYSARREDDRPRREGSRERKFDDRPARTGRSDERSPKTYSARREDDRPRRDDDDRPKRKRRDVTAESEILTEIVAKRKREGRQAPQKQKILSLEYDEKYGPIRLNKYISNSGICSRRDADTLIQTGAIRVNGEIVTELGHKVLPTDEVRYEDKILQREKPVYVLLNKPKDYITTTRDDRDRKDVMELVRGACKERIYPVGRLDKNTTGLLLFTNDGEMTKKLTHPQHGVRKIYGVELNKNLANIDMAAIRNGLELDDGVIIPDEVSYVGESKRDIGITIHSGKNRIVRRIFESLGYEVVKLDRVVFAGLTKRDLPRGKWRFLTEAEINILRMSVRG